MNSVAQTQRSITIGYGPSFAKTEIWRDLRSKLIVPTEIVSLATAQRYNPALILLDHYLLRDIDFARWTEEFPEAVFLCTDSLDIDADLVLTHSLLYRLSAQHTPYVRASIQDVEHDSEHPVFFNTIRSDDNETVTAGWLWTVARNLVVTGEASYTDNKSDIELFDYSRFRYQLGFRYQF